MSSVLFQLVNAEEEFNWGILVRIFKVVFSNPSCYFPFLLSFFSLLLVFDFLKDKFYSGVSVERKNALPVAAESAGKLAQ